MAAPAPLTIQLKGPTGADMGSATLTEAPGGLIMRVEAKGLFFTYEVFMTYTAVRLLADAIERALDIVEAEQERRTQRRYTHHLRSPRSRRLSGIHRHGGETAVLAGQPETDAAFVCNRRPCGRRPETQYRRAQCAVRYLCTCHFFHRRPPAHHQLRAPCHKRQEFAALCAKIRISVTVEPQIRAAAEPDTAR